MKKKLGILCLAMLLCANMFTTISFASEVPEAPTDSTTTSTQQMRPMVEETEWVYRYNNGVLQKRLWSLTYGKWLTEWVDCQV